MKNVIQQKIEEEANKLYLSAERLETEHFDIIYNEPSLQGHGYKVDLKDTWVEVWLSALPFDPSTAFITLFKKNPKHPNYFDSFGCEELREEATTELDEVYSIVKTMITRI